jgi:transcriptional regulator with XRE-family HTH domain
MIQHRRYWLMDIRRNKELSVQEVSLKSNISKQYYSMIENGLRGQRISFLAGARVARALGLTLDEFYDLEQKYQSEVSFLKETANES